MQLTNFIFPEGRTLNVKYTHLNSNVAKVRKLWKHCTASSVSQSHNTEVSYKITKQKHY